jgi:cytochrome d ubiquinol oxidase subunit I
MWAIMLALTLWAGWLAWRRRLFRTPAFLRAATWAIPTGYIAVTAGWITTEVGRQPFVVYGHMRTADAVTPTLTGGDVLVSLAAYVVVYLVVFGAGLYYLVRLIQRGPPERLEGHELRPAERAARPLSAAADSDG